MIRTEHIDIPKDHVEKWGNYNDAPPGWTRITIKELTQKTHFGDYDPELIEHRQIINPGKPMIPATLLFYHDGTGVGIVCDYWKASVTYYRFGCQHKYQEISQDECCKRGIFHQGNCYHVSICDKCGHINAVDSSD